MEHTSLLSDLVSAAVLLLIAGSVTIWQLTGADPLLQVARAAIFTRCALIVAARHVIAFGREWRKETVQMYRWVRASEGL